MRWIRQGIVTLAVLILTACGEKFVYNNIDWFVVDYVESYIDLERSQNEILTQRVQLTAQWHKENELPIYIDHFDDLLALKPQDFTVASLQAQENKFRQHSKRLVQYAAPDLYSLSKQLSDEQVEELLSNLSEEHQEFREEFSGLEDDELAEVYQSRINKNMQRWLGDLTPEQEELVIDWSTSIENTIPDWVEYHHLLREQLEKTLSVRDDSSKFQSRFEPLIFEKQSMYSESFKRKRESNRQIARVQISEIFQQMTPKQYRHLQDELERWRTLALELASN